MPPSERAIHFYYDYCNLGGVTSILKQRIALMRRRGVQAAVVLHFLRDLGGRPDLDALDGVTLRFCPDDRFHPWCAETVAAAPGALHVLLDQPEVVALLGDGAPGVVYEVHTSLEQAFRRMRGVGFAGVQRILCPSAWLKRKLAEVLVDYPAERIRVCPNFVDPDLFRPLPPGPDAAGEPILLWIGKLNPDKNLGDALEVMRRLRRRAAFRPVIVTGGGAERPAVIALLSRLEALGLAEKARWITNLSNAAMPALLADVRASGGALLSTSKFESFGLAVLEAMSCGVPPVCAAVGGLQELVRDGTDGYLYPLTRPELAVKHLAGLLADRTRQARMGEAAIHGASRFAADAAIETYMRELLGSRT
ncbi:glycosyltransferase family 4 protein [Falsiroseomonas sp. CW058]|uniref:glycosyltransferase family 4 protein n=1 Tax=Falsiroseomonas sp. CW058 TaxID=3388664 RepID=UPI003D320F25